MKLGTCLFCLQEGVQLQKEHIFPKSWYPNGTNASQRFTLSVSCDSCNKSFGRIEDEIGKRVGLVFDPNDPVFGVLADKAYRSISPDQGRSEQDVLARTRERFRVMNEVILYDSRKHDESVFPGMGDRSLFNRDSTVRAVCVDSKKLETIFEKLIIGAAFHHHGFYIAKDYNIEIFPLHFEDYYKMLRKIGNCRLVIDYSPAFSIRSKFAEVDGVVVADSIHDVELFGRMRSIVVVKKSY